MLSIPVIGTWTHWSLFGGEFPGNEHHPRGSTSLHVLLIPGILLALIAVHLGLVVVSRSTPSAPARAGPSTTWSACGCCPRFAAKDGGFFAVVVRRCIALMGGLFQINPIWLFGPYNAAVRVGRRPARLVRRFLDG